MYKLVIKYMNGTKTEKTASMYNIAIMYASNVAKDESVLSVGVYNSSGEECAMFRNNLPGGQASRHIHFLIGKYKSRRNNFMDLADPDVIKYRAHYQKGEKDDD